VVLLPATTLLGLYGLLALEGGYGAETDLSRVQHRRGRDYSAARLGKRRD